ncbi:hypothetical protein Poli38472_008894 [Pythium oligandrum]|uniref:Tudor domain-containing protein n=1 Tax=Pythium oligandrum TaxID=41045 RepID=A0A8K1C4F2_PYTOL|nr:hypothetical protein Poli38472_008894 [Pythium oligandrum]|eukprot:TMW56246.1 hypothetical protein Poli38472_008894 [Pythium oligandrum]
MPVDDQAIARVLQTFAVSKPRADELEYVAELVLSVVEDETDVESAALVPTIVETLEDVNWLDQNKLTELCTALERVITGKAEDDSDSDEDAKTSALDRLKEEYAIGKDCLVVLEEDDEWHPARITRHVEGEAMSAASFRVEVEFIEFGKKQIAEMTEIVLDEDVADGDDDGESEDVCEMCERPMRLTLHHLIPRETHERYRKKGYTQEFLNTCARICRPCHSKIHSTEDNKTLARDYNTVEKIMTHPDIQRWVSYAKKQRTSIRPLKKSKWPVGK